MRRWEWKQRNGRWNISCDFFQRVFFSCTIRTILSNNYIWFLISVIFSNFLDSVYRGILIPYCIFSRNPFCLICIHNTTEVARLLALTYYLPLFNSQLLNKNHAANLIAEFLLTRPLRDVTSSDLIETLWNVISTHTFLAGRDVGWFEYRNKE